MPAWTYLSYVCCDLRPGVLVALCSLFVLAADLDPDSIVHSHKVRMFSHASLGSLIDCVYASLGLQDYCPALLMATHILTGAQVSYA